MEDPKAPLFQSYRREIPGGEGYLERDLYLHPGFSITVIRSSGLILDYGLQAEMVRYISRLRVLNRSQLSILLAGRGYFGVGGRIVDLCPGDVVASDQTKLEPEGYAGDPMEVLIVAWTGDRFFGPPIVGDTRLGRIGPSDVASLRAHLAENRTAGHAALEGLVERLCALGLPRPADGSCAPSNPSAPLARVFGVLGGALSHLDQQPSLSEIAESCSLTERHLHRLLQDLERVYGFPFAGWRDLVQDSRVAWATSVLSLPSLPVGHAAKIAGYRSPVALAHAFSSRCGATPGGVARLLRERWDP